MSLSDGGWIENFQQGLQKMHDITRQDQRVTYAYIYHLLNGAPVVTARYALMHTTQPAFVPPHHEIGSNRQQYQPMGGRLFPQCRLEWLRVFTIYDTTINPQHHCIYQV